MAMSAAVSLLTDWLMSTFTSFVNFLCNKQFSILIKMVEEKD